MNEWDFVFQLRITERDAFILSYMKHKLQYMKMQGNWFSQWTRRFTQYRDYGFRRQTDFAKLVDRGVAALLNGYEEEIKINP